MPPRSLLPGSPTSGRGRRACTWLHQGCQCRCQAGTTGSASSRALPVWGTSWICVGGGWRQRALRRCTPMRPSSAAHIPTPPGCIPHPAPRCAPPSLTVCVAPGRAARTLLQLNVGRRARHADAAAVLARLAHVALCVVRIGCGGADREETPSEHNSTGCKRDHARSLAPSWALQGAGPISLRTVSSSGPSTTPLAPSAQHTWGQRRHRPPSA